MFESQNSIVQNMSIPEALVILREYQHSAEAVLFGVPITPELRRAAVDVVVKNKIDDLIIRDRSGALINIHPQTDGITSRFLLIDGVYEAPTHVFIRHVLRPGDIFIDIGANIGCHAVTAAKIVGPSGRVICFEPNPEMRRLLEFSKRLNNADHMIVHAVAISDIPGELKLVVNPIHPGNGCLTIEEFASESALEQQEASVRGSIESSMIPLPGQGFDTSPFQDFKPKVYEIEVRQLSSYITAEQAEKVRLVKIDVEGLEMSVLRSGVWLWDNPSPPIVIVEYEERYAGARAEIFDMFADRGWIGYVASEGEQQKPTLNKLSEPYVASLFENLFIVPPHLQSEVENGCMVVDYPHEEMRSKYDARNVQTTSLENENAST